METSSAPGKVFLFGEHAVVYGEPAVLCAIDRRVTVTAEETEGGDTVDAPDLPVEGVSARAGDDGTELTGGIGDELAYVESAIRKARDEVGASSGVEVTVESDIPVGAGLGSSAAVVVATIDAVGRELGDGIRRDRTAELGHDVEKEVQGNASPADSFTSATGGVVYVEPEVEMRVLDSPELGFVVGYDGNSAPTGEMVEGVRRLTESNPVADDIVGLVGDLTREGVESVEDGDTDAVGELMNLNHGLLEALGVGSASLSRMVWAARDSGALGAKLTGAGGSGCVVALSDGERDGSVVSGVGVVAEEVFTATAAEGVREE